MDAAVRANILLFSQSWAEVIRYLISYTIHHRGQFSVYLWLLDVPVPYIYGPTADEATMWGRYLF